MKVYLLVAGYATRLHPLTLGRPKALLEIGGRPMLSHLLDRIRVLEGLREVVVVSNHRFVGSFEAWCAAADCPVPIRCLDDGSTTDSDKLGAIGDLAFALREDPPRAGEPVVAIAGDNWLGFDLEPAQQAYTRAGGETTLLVRELDRVPPGPSPYNEVTLDGAGRVTRFREKPDDPATSIAAIALYFFAPGIEERIATYLSAGGNPDAPGYFIEWLVRREAVHAHRFEGDWMDIGSVEALARARERFG